MRRDRDRLIGLSALTAGAFLPPVDVDESGGNGYGRCRGRRGTKQDTKTCKRTAKRRGVKWRRRRSR